MSPYLVPASGPLPGESREDDLLGREDYSDVTGSELALLLSLADSASPVSRMAIDTEGSADQPWSIQVSVADGQSWVLRREREDFSIGVSAIQSLADRGAVVVFQNAMHDLSVCRAMGLSLRRARLYDTRYAAYLLLEPEKGLKYLARVWAGMTMTSYEDTVESAGRERQVAYLEDVAAINWPPPPPRVVSENDGTQRVYKPQSISKRAASILKDVRAGKVGADGEPVNPYKRWRDVDRDLRAEVESPEIFGPMRGAHISDVEPVERAIAYAGRDSDATFRIQPLLDAAVTRRRLRPLMSSGMRVLPVFEEMQATGMPASRSRFLALRDEMTERMADLQRRISQEYYGGRPFNPKSPKYVASLLRRYGLEPAEYTDTGAPSTSKQSIEHLRAEHPSIELTMQWRECQHTRDMFCQTTLDLMDEQRRAWLTLDVSDVHWVRCQLLPYRTTTRRLASKEPNLLAMPKHSELGKRVRDCYVAPEGWVFLECDLSQIEGRFLAHESRDQLLCDVFLAGRDIHTETAALLFDVPPEQVTKNQRTFAKRINFGIPYGTSEYGMETQLRVMGIADWDRQDCKRFIAQWMRIYSTCARYFEETERETLRTGEVRDHWGMPRLLPNVHSDDRGVAAEARRQAVNHKIQGGAQGMIQNSMVHLDEPIAALQDAGVGVKWLLQIHDALLLLVEEEWAETVGEIVVDGLVNHSGIELRVPVLADVRTADTWGGL